jgi:hypothetical protein
MQAGTLLHNDAIRLSSVYGDCTFLRPLLLQLAAKGYATKTKTERIPNHTLRMQKRNLCTSRVVPHGLHTRPTEAYLEYIIHLNDDGIVIKMPFASRKCHLSWVLVDFFESNED